MTTVAAPALSRSQRYRRLMESLSIRSERSTIVPMRFSQSQEVLWSKVAPRIDAGEKLWFVVCKGRQVYSSTFFQALMFARTVSQPNTNSLVLAQDLFSSHVLFDMAKRFYDHFPMPKMRPATTQELSFPFPDGESRYRVISAGKAAKGRGANFTCVHASECAHYERADVMLGLAQTLPDLPHTMWVLESTANGKRGPGEYFYNEWQNAISGESDLIPIFVPWYVLRKYRRAPGVPPDDWTAKERMLAATFGIDGEQIAWRRAYLKTKCQGDESKFDQEYPVSPEVAFIATGVSAFSQDAVLAHRAAIREPAQRGYLRKSGDRWRVESDPRGWLRVWDAPREGGQYVIGVDTAEGIEDELGRGREGDYACAQVVDMRSLEQVACIHGHIAPWDFADILNDLGRWYRNATLAVEINNHGHTVQDRLIRELHYPNLHRWRGKPDRMMKLANASRVYGWETNSYSRPLMIDAGRRVIDTGLVTIREEKLLDEISNFSMMDNGKYEAEYGNDDRIIALLIALRSREENYFPARLTPEISERIEEGVEAGVRIVDGRDWTADGQRKISKILRTRSSRDTGRPWYDTRRRPDDAAVRRQALAAAKDWMAY